MEFLTWLSNPDIERGVLLDKSMNEVVAMQTKNLLDSDVNVRYNGMHVFAAQALKGAKGGSSGLANHGLRFNQPNAVEKPSRTCNPSDRANPSAKRRLNTGAGQKALVVLTRG